MIRSFVISIFKDSLTLCHIPSSWQSSLGIFINKPGKSDYFLSSSWRTLNLSCILLKVLEKVIFIYLTDVCQVDTQLDDNQLGFRKGRSCDEALHKLVSCIERALSNNLFAVGSFIDIKAAFDSITISSIVSAIRELNLPPFLAAWIHKFLTTKTVIFNLKEMALNRFIIKGTPQGGVLSPYLWNLVFSYY